MEHLKVIRMLVSYMILKALLKPPHLRGCNRYRFNNILYSFIRGFGMSIRRIAKIFKSQPTIEGAGVHLKRAFGYSQVPLLDPFLMLDDFHTSIPGEYLAGFPWHPHRGIETITYVLEGLVEHGDRMGNKGVIGAGDVQWIVNFP